MSRDIDLTSNQDRDPIEKEPGSRPSVFSTTEHDIDLRTAAISNYRSFTRKGNSGFFIRDAANVETGINLDPTKDVHKVVLHLMDHPLVQRLRQIQQLSTAPAVFMGGQHTRFAHSVGSGALAIRTLDILRTNVSHQNQTAIDYYAPAVVACSILHDLGHLAPGSHMAEKVWFPKGDGEHEKITLRFIKEDRGMQYLLGEVIPNFKDLPKVIEKILTKDPDVPKWTWKIVMGGGWNIDRGDWLIRDSVHCGVKYGEYDLPLLLKRLRITNEGDFAISERGLESIEQFFEARKHMYNSVMYHEVSRVVWEMYMLVSERARELFLNGELNPKDEVMAEVLEAKTSDKLSVGTLQKMTEAWWNSNLSDWSEASDPILSDLSRRLITRNLFKNMRADAVNKEQIKRLVENAGLDPHYYFVEMPAKEHKYEKDLKEALVVMNSRGEGSPLEDNTKVMRAFMDMKGEALPGLIAVPADIFPQLH